MNIRTARFLSTILFLALGVTVLLLRSGGYLPEWFTNIGLLVLIVVANAAYFVIGRFYNRVRKTNRTTVISDQGI